MKEALDNGHPFEDIYQGFVEFEDGKVGFIFADPKLLALVESEYTALICDLNCFKGVVQLRVPTITSLFQRLKNSSSMLRSKHGLTTTSFLSC